MGLGQLLCGCICPDLHAAADQADEQALLKELRSHSAWTVRLIINSPDPSGWRVLQKAAGEGQEAAVAALLALKADPWKAEATSQWTALHSAAVNGHPGCLKLLLESGAKKARRRGILADGPPDARQRRPIHWAAAQNTAGHTACVKLLLEAGASVLATDRDGLTSLHIAAAAGHVGAIRLLLAAGADPTARTPTSGRTPADLAGQGRHAEALELLRLAVAAVHGAGGQG